MVTTAPIKLINYLLLIVVSVFIATPFVYTLLDSFKTQQEIFQVPQSFLPKNFVLDNYANILTGNFIDYFLNSVIITIWGVVLVVILSALAGYAFARLPFKGREVLLVALLLIITMPLAIFLIPMYMMENTFGILNTKLGLILPNVAVVLPFAIFIMRGTFVGIPKEIEESAEMDGCGVVRTWWHIMMPIAKNGLVIIIIHAFYNIWGEYTLAKTLSTDQTSMPLTVGLTLFKGEVWAFGTLSSVIVLSMLPPIIIFILFQRQMVEGITQGSIKG
ncbi:carbohydrate ABC transporter permease [Paenibacillus filicis]|uniref:Carbohydrate ABC transporter permease n=1 Tax=Paenibacillus gyeongsangnamensis TaxID=3388067 RepID=A0ABT4Q5V0_9BACL|nr:carbohydrate ABC transporter permease [Paenibacillus filicis]MCZ8512167.1 carbohydrate ABC transporter permease [Paenibacillus filicis]